MDPYAVGFNALKAHCTYHPSIHPSPCVLVYEPLLPREANAWCVVVMSRVNAAVALRMRERKRRAAASAPYSTATRKQRQSPSHSSAVARKNQLHPPPRSASKRSTTATSGNALLPLPHQRCTAFVRDMAETCKWSKQLTHGVCATMHRFLHLYRSNQLQAFFQAVVDATPGTTDDDDVLVCRVTTCADWLSCVCGCGGFGQARRHRT